MRRHTCAEQWKIKKALKKAKRSPEVRRRAHNTGERLLTAQANVDSRGKAGSTHAGRRAPSSSLASSAPKKPVGWAEVLAAAPSGEQLEAIGRLIARGVDVNEASGPTHQSPLLLATAAGNTLAMSQLLAMGANINFKDSTGQTALHTFVRGAKGAHEALGLLLCSRADVTLKDTAGNTALDVAIAREDVFSAAELTKSLAEMDGKATGAPASAVAQAGAAPAPAPSVVATAPQFCSQCGVAVTGMFCTSCGAKQ